ncbi:MAG: hybrid sensor histidine kinase/response regulator [Leptospiraceae bacterium]|nr:hybrid sensor histidine kinase/response regulator [Leptospiraceae bacterium]MCP5494048.1 hybrid sensor histidine kinase/response regulator [Leptospiraceae bacterium]
MNMESEQCNILIVDDTPKNIQVVAKLLKTEGYQMSFATNGTEAIEQIRNYKFDLILLDVIMSDVDGYKVCEILKSDPQLRDIPVIFLTAKTELKDIVKGFEVGGVDYLTKPFQPTELLARVRTHLLLKKAREEIEFQKIQLEKQNFELLEVVQLREDMEHVTQHDLKTPLNTIISYPSLIRIVGNLTEEQEDYLRNIEHSGIQMLNMINNSLDLVKMERGVYEFNPDSFDIAQVIQKVTMDLYNKVESKDLTLKILHNSSPIQDTDTVYIMGEELLCYSMFANLIKNAIEASPIQNLITIDIDNTHKDFVYVQIHNVGTIPREIQDKFFEKYVTYGKGGKATGLGAYSAKLIVKTHNGSIDMTTSEKEGTTIIVCLPIKE